MMAKLINIALLIAAITMGQAADVSAGDKQIVGWAEIVSIYPGSVKIKAKLDTGADHSSLNAKKIKFFDVKGESWVRFEFRNFEERLETHEARIVRIAKIKRLGHEAVNRPTINLGICIGSTYKEVEVNLTDRSGFNYPMLIGRSFLKGSFLIDPELSFISSAACMNAAEK
jgi:hypothetical protein